jgi:hypothetical protein
MDDQTKEVTKMSNIISFTRKEAPDIGNDFTGFSSFTGEDKRNPEELFLSVGAAASVGILLILCFAYEGLSLIYLGFTGIQLAGIGIVLAVRSRTSEELTSCIRTEADSEIKTKPERRETINKKAA